MSTRGPSERSRTEPRIQSPPSPVVVGLGNELLRDDGVGVHAVRLLAEQARTLEREGVVIAEVGTAVVDAMHLFERAELVVAIDAMQGGRPPGTIYRATIEDLEDDARLASGGLGLHQLGLVGALRMLALELDASSHPWRPPRIHVVGVEPQHLDTGLALSEPVRRVLPQVAEEVWRLLGG